MSRLGHEKLVKWTSTDADTKRGDCRIPNQYFFVTMQLSNDVRNVEIFGVSNWICLALVIEAPHLMKLMCTPRNEVSLLLIVQPPFRTDRDDLAIVNHNSANMMLTKYQPHQNVHTNCSDSACASPAYQGREGCHGILCPPVFGLASPNSADKCHPRGSDPGSLIRKTVCVNTYARSYDKSERITFGLRIVEE
jgi:hypothetical protein